MISPGSRVEWDEGPFDPPDETTIIHRGTVLRVEPEHGRLVIRHDEESILHHIRPEWVREIPT